MNRFTIVCSHFSHVNYSTSYREGSEQILFAIVANTKIDYLLKYMVILFDTGNTKANTKI